MDGFYLASPPSRGRVKKDILTRQGESSDAGTNASFAWRVGAVSNASMHLEHSGANPFLVYRVNVPSTYSNTFLRVRYSDDVGPNKVQVYVDNALRAKFPSEDTGYWTDFRNSSTLFLGAITSGTREIRIASDLATWGVDVDEFELFALYDNRPPEISLDALRTLAVGASTGFVVTATDPDHDAVLLSNTARPAGSTFVTNHFAWTAGAADENSTNLLVFVADDQKGLTNSVVTNLAQIVVPADWDGDGIADGWEWTHFESLTNDPAADSDGDGADNRHEYIAGTEPTDGGSRFESDAPATEDETNHLIVVPTQPGREYTIYYTDHELSNGVPWRPFANPADDIGTWMETNTVSSTHVFVDDEGANTTGGPPERGRRYYRVKVRKIP